MPNTSDCATVWFAILERAHRLGDHKRAAEALRNLKDRGVEVRFPRRQTISQRPDTPSRGHSSIKGECPNET